MDILTSIQADAHSKLFKGWHDPSTAIYGIHMPLIDKLILASAHTMFWRITICNFTKFSHHARMFHVFSIFVIDFWQQIIRSYFKMNIHTLVWFFKFSPIYPWDFIFSPMKRRLNDGGVRTCHVLICVTSIRRNFFNRCLRMKASKISVHIDVIWAVEKFTRQVHKQIIARLM